MARKRKIDKPFNFGYNVLYNEYPKELHVDLNVPGIYRRKSNRKVYFKDGSIGEMDSSYIVGPDFEKIFEPMVANGEHQSTPVGKDKIKMISYYGIQQIHDESLPQFSYIASHIDKEKHVQSYKRSPTDIIEPYFLDLGEEDNEKRLNNVREIIKQQEDISNEDALNLGIIALFAPRNNAQNITEEVVMLYGEIADRLSQKMEFALYSVLYAMVDAYFDDENEYRRVIKMLKEKTSQESVEKVESLDIAQNKISELEKANASANGKISDLEKAYASANGKISDLEKANASANGKISDLEDEIMYLKSQLNDK